MKINKFGMGNQPVVAEREQTGKAEKVGDYFASDLLKTQEKQSSERLQALLVEIDESGRRLSNMPTYGELKSYRELVRKFIGEAVSRMYTLESRAGWDRHGRQKMFTTIRQVDEKLSEMAEDVRGGQERQLSIMSKHDAVRGMLVDLYT
ncbi:MAG TPA: YaaR family protein [Sporomusa sp.]|nr:YaaR family protein [Sporomusa sp.]HWR42871.1 YaaR family protein [Sporomusa sp.]